MTGPAGMTEVVGEEPAAGAVLPDDPGPRFIDRFDPRLVNVVTVLGFALPVAVYFWMIHRYSVNVIFGDQWDDVTVIGHSYSHLFDWGSLWAQHNENRIFFPNLIVLLLAHTTHFNIQVEEYLGAIMLVVATGLLIWAHKRRAISTPWLYYCPVALLVFSTVQYENSLWGFQMAWYLVLLSLATAIVLIDRPTLTWLTLAGAIVAGVVGSFSSLQGLLIWPAGLVLLYHRRRAVRFVAAWIAATAASIILYLYNFNTSATSGSPSHGYVLHHPVAAIKFYVFAVGDIVGLPRQYNGPGSNPVLLLGLSHSGSGRAGRGGLRPPPRRCRGRSDRDRPHLRGPAVRRRRDHRPGPLRLPGGQRIPVHHVRPVDPDRDLHDPPGTTSAGKRPPTGGASSRPDGECRWSETSHRYSVRPFGSTGPSCRPPVGSLPSSSWCRSRSGSTTGPRVPPLITPTRPMPHTCFGTSIGLPMVRWGTTCTYCSHHRSSGTRPELPSCTISACSPTVAARDPAPDRPGWGAVDQLTVLPKAVK